MTIMTEIPDRNETMRQQLHLDHLKEEEKESFTNSCTEFADSIKVKSKINMMLEQGILKLTLVIFCFGLLRKTKMAFSYRL